MPPACKPASSFFCLPGGGQACLLTCGVTGRNAVSAYTRLDDRFRDRQPDVYAAWKLDMPYGKPAFGAYCCPRVLVSDREACLQASLQASPQAGIQLPRSRKRFLLA